MPFRPLMFRVVGRLVMRCGCGWPPIVRLAWLSDQLDLSALVDGREIEVGVDRRAGHLQSAEFDLECQCCGYRNMLEFAFDEDDGVYAD